MKFCLDCQFAKWQKTKGGKLHPSGDGRCLYHWKLPPLPASFYWLSMNPPAPSGGFINRKQELKEHCPYYCQKEEDA